MILSGDAMSRSENIALYLLKRVSFSSLRMVPSFSKFVISEGGAGSTDPYMFSTFASFLDSESLLNAN